MYLFCEIRMENLPLVSVVMAVLNGEKYIAEALISALDQTYENMEILVCDDASNDATLEIVQEIKHQHDIDDKIRILKQSHTVWIAKNSNTWIEAATWEYISILDHDDTWRDQNKTTKQLEFLSTNPEHKIVGTNAISNKRWEWGWMYFPQTDKSIRSFALTWSPMLHSSVVYDKTIAKKVWWYAENYKYAMDYKLILDIMKQAKWANLADITTYYRRHWNNISILKQVEQEQEAKLIRQEHIKNFPCMTKAMICRQSVWLLNEIFGQNPTYLKIKSEAKRLYFKT